MVELNIKGLIIYLVWITTSFFVTILVLSIEEKYIVFYPLVLLVATIYYIVVDSQVHGEY